MKLSSSLYTLLGLCFFGFGLGAEPISCPMHPTEEGDSYQVMERHSKLKKAAFGAEGTKQLTKQKKHNRGADDSDLYLYTISLCGAADKSVTQKDMTDTNKKVTNIGRFNDSLVFGGVDWLMYSYGGGDKYHSFCNHDPRRTLLLVKCEDGSRESTLEVIEEARQTNQMSHNKKPFCYYLFEYNHPAACSASSVKTRPKKLSRGSVLCIIFVSISLAYIIFGMLYKRFVTQAKGYEQIPNYSFWLQLGNLIADGCDLVFRRHQQPANSYKGMADTLNIDSSDDEKDDQLLPM